jgi:hypothetical protein
MRAVSFKRVLGGGALSYEGLKAPAQNQRGSLRSPGDCIGS